MPGNEPSLMPLLRSVASECDGVGAARFDDKQIDFVVALGLGPLLNYLVRNGREAIPSAHRPLVAGADLAGEAAHAKLRAALCDILDASDGLSDTITLLKGMSICRHYPRPHMRTMGDIDLLAAADAVPELERVLVDLGYERGDFGMPPGFYEDHHHTRPFRHPESNVRVEVHRRLFPPHCRIADSSVLGIDNVLTQRVASTFEGRAVLRLRSEMQLTYLAAHWAYDMHLPLVSPGLFDILFLLRNERATLDWGLVHSWLHEREAATPLYLLFAYLERHGLLGPEAEAEAETIARLDRAPKSVGRVGTRAMHAILDQCLDARFLEHAGWLDLMETLWRTLASPKPPAANLYAVPRDMLFPPHHPQRFRLGFQLRRLMSMLGWQKGPSEI